MNAQYEYFSELLSLYTDGQLNETEQQMLFAELTRNGSLREELSHTLLIRNTLRSQKHTPPAQLRNAVFAQTGLQTTNTVTPGIQSVGADHRITLLSFAAGALLMFVLNGFVFKSNNTLSQNNNPMQVEIGGDNHQSPTRETANKGYGKSASDGMQNGKETMIAEHPAFRRNSRAEGATHKRREGWRNDGVVPEETRPLFSQLQSEQNALTNEGTQPVVNASAPNNTSDATTASDALLRNNTLDPLTAHSQQPPIQNTTQNTRSDAGVSLSHVHVARSLPFSLELRGFMMQSFPQFGLPGLIDPPINNIAALLQWNVSEKWSVGIEAGQETILQEFEIIDGKNTTIIRQNHLGVWGGINAQYILYTPDEASFFSISPVLRGTLGATRMGPMLRIGAGALLRINERADIAFGLESAAFAYQQSNVWHSTTKLGTTLGLQIHF